MMAIYNTKKILDADMQPDIKEAGEQVSFSSLISVQAAIYSFLKWSKKTLSLTKLY